MQKKMLLITLIIFLSLHTLWAVETRLSMEFWNRYTYERKESKTVRGIFSLERGYFRIEPTFTDKIKGRFNLDFFASDAYPHGGGIKIKYAYVEFNEPIPIPESKFVFGLNKNCFGTVFDWKYVTIEKSLEDKEKVISSADYGIFFTGFIPQGFGEYGISLINGEGYSKVGRHVNINPASVINLRLIPLPGVTLGGSLLYEKAGFLDTIKTKYDKRMLYAGVARFAIGPLDAWFEYLSQQLGVTTKGEYKETKSQGLMIMPVLRLVRPLDLVLRYDRWDPNTKKEKDAHSTLIVGFNWNIQHDAQGAPVLFVQTNWDRKIPEDPKKDPSDIIRVQLRWRFGTTIKG